MFKSTTVKKKRNRIEGYRATSIFTTRTTVLSKYVIKTDGFMIEFGQLFSGLRNLHSE